MAELLIRGALMVWPGCKLLGALLAGGALGLGFAALCRFAGVNP